jgi:dCTP deaminase
VTFWSGELLEARLPKLIFPFEKGNLDCASYRLSAGEQAFVTTADLESQKPDVNLIRKLGTSSDNGAIRISPGQFAFLLTEEDVTVPSDALAMISIRAGYKFKGLINVSGFHVDPGWQGKLIFSVYNAGTKPIIIRRGEPLFLIVYAHLDRDSQKTYQGKAKFQKEISTQLVEDLTSTVFSPQSLKNRLDDVNEKLSNIERTWKVAAGIAAVIIAIPALLVSAFALWPGLSGAIIAAALNSAGYKLVTINANAEAGQLPLVNNVVIPEAIKQRTTTNLQGAASPANERSKLEPKQALEQAPQKK